MSTNTTLNDLSRKKRARAFVTKNACTECRRRKARCDGRKPCARCSTLSTVICHYAVSMQISKELMRADIEELQSQRQTSEHILYSLATGNQSEFILQQLRSGETLEDISKSLGPIINSPQRVNRSSNSNQMNWEPGPGSSGTESWSISPNDSGGRLLDDSPNFSFDSGYTCWDAKDDDYLQDDEQWTSLTSDREMIEHLLSLYFCWEYPIFASLSKRYFLEDFRAGRRRFSDRHIMTTAEFARNETADDQFFAEAERLWQVEQHDPSLTTTQATALMSIREASCGRDSRSWFYAGQSIRMAVELGLQAQSNEADMAADEYEVRCITFWGAFTLDEVWSLSTGRVPYISRNGLRVGKPVVMDSDEQSEWMPYTDDGKQSGSVLHQRSNVQSIFESFCTLSEVVHQSLYILYAPGRHLTSQDILGIYKRYINWYDSIPTALRTGENSTPAVLFTHMYYHYAILLLFGPLTKFTFANSSISPTEICTQAAEAITSLVSSYRQLFSLRRTPCFVPYIVLASSIVHLAVTDTNSNFNQAFPSTNPFMQILQGTADLLEMAPSHNFARRATQVLRIMAQNQNNADAAAAADAAAERVHCSTNQSEGLIKKEAILLAGPTSTGMADTNFLSPNMEEILLKRCGSMDNSIFSPFPSQDLLMLDDNEERLRRDGFELIK